MRVVALGGQLIDFRSVFVCLLLDEPMRDHPLKIFDEAWIVQSKPHLEVCFFQMSIIVEYV